MTTPHSLARVAAILALLCVPALAVGARAQPSMPGMTGGPMEHPGTSPPFYRERTFLVLLGIGVAGAGFAAYRVGRARRRQRPGPRNVVNEAVLVVDLVDSTHLATHYGEGLAMRARNAVKDRAVAAAGPRGVGFTENTGDGCLMTFPSVAGAADTAIALLRDLHDRPPDLSPGPLLAVRAGITYGEILLDERGGRHGAAINKAFRIEGLSRESFAQVGPEGLPPKISGRDRIFMDEEAAKELAGSDIPHRPVGFSSLKGFSGLHRVYEVLWERPQLEGRP